MNTVLGGSKNIPQILPEGFTPEQYRESLSFRVMLQMLSSLINDKETQKNTISKLTDRVLKQAKKFPTIPFPVNLIVSNKDKTDSVVLDPNDLLLRLHKFFGIRPEGIKEIKKTDDFSVELERILAKINPSSS